MRSSITGLFLLLALFLAACGKKAEPVAAPAPVEAAKPKEPTLTTEGDVLLATRIRAKSDTLEILCVPEISPETRELIAKQQAALQEYLNPPEDIENGSAELSASDNKRLQDELIKIKKEMPEPFVSQFRIKDNSRQIESRRSLYERYLPMVNDVNAVNLESSLNAIFTLMQQDHETLKALAADGESNSALQAMADINWLATFSDYMNGFKSIVRRYDSAVRRQARKLQRDAGQGIQGPQTPEQVWQASQWELAPKIELEIYKTSLGAAYVDEGNHFALTGHGILVARTEIHGKSVFFVNDGPGGELVRFTDIVELQTDPE